MLGLAVVAVEGRIVLESGAFVQPVFALAAVASWLSVRNEAGVAVQTAQVVSTGLTAYQCLQST